MTDDIKSSEKSQGQLLADELLTDRKNGILPLSEGDVGFVGFFLHKHLRINDPEMLFEEV